MHSPAAREPAPVLAGAHIRRIRRTLGWSQADLARALDVRRETVAEWELGRTRMSRLSRNMFSGVLCREDVAQRLSDALQRDASQEADEDDERPASASAA